MKPITRLLPAILAASLAAIPAASATVATVLGTDDIYNAPAGGFDGTTPIGINVAGATSITILADPGATVTVNGGSFNDADGVGSVSSEYNTGTAAISGISAPTAGYIAGVFYLPGAPLPAALDFTGAGGTAFTSLSPALNQAFFVGDGRTGDGTGAVQTFFVPAGATTLYLGLTDACGYSGSPSCYGDNSGSFNVNYTLDTSVVAAVPEPVSLALLGTGIAVAGLFRRRAAAV